MKIKTINNIIIMLLISWYKFKAFNLLIHYNKEELKCACFENFVWFNIYKKLQY